MNRCVGEVGRIAARCAGQGCNSHPVEIVIVVDLTTVERELAALRSAITEQGEHMSEEVDAKLTELEQAEAAEAVDLARELGDLRDALAGKLSADEVARFDALITQAGKNTADIDAVDPAPVAPADGTVAAEPAPAEDAPAA